MRYVNFIEDGRGDLVGIELYCSTQCWRDAGLGDPFGHAWRRALKQRTTRRHCPHCGVVVVAAIGEPSFDGWPVSC